MGAPMGHTFFGNQYTDGGYINGTYIYKDKGVEIIESASNVIRQAATNVATRQKQDTLTRKNNHDIKDFDRNTLIVGGIIVVATVVSGYITYKLQRKKVNTKQDTKLSVELQNVGTCTHCGEPLIGSNYVPEDEEDSYNAYIICKKCGEKNFARYPDESDSATAKANV